MNTQIKQKSARQAFACRACRSHDGRGGLLGRMAGATGTGSVIGQSRTGGNPGSNRFRAMLAAEHQK